MILSSDFRERAHIKIFHHRKLNLDSPYVFQIMSCNLLSSSRPRLPPLYQYVSACKTSSSQKDNTLYQRHCPGPK